jgi:hypothetical protein
LTVQVVYKERSDYWIHGVVLATAARMVTERKGVQAGVHFLADAVDPIAFMEALRKAGVKQTETFEPCGERRCRSAHSVDAERAISHDTESHAHQTIVHPRPTCSPVCGEQRL